MTLHLVAVLRRDCCAGYSNWPQLTSCSYRFLDTVAILGEIFEKLGGLSRLFGSYQPFTILLSRHPPSHNPFHLSSHLSGHQPLLACQMPSIIQSYEVLLDFTNDTHDCATVQLLRDYGRNTGATVLLHPGESVTLVLDAGAIYQYALKTHTKVANVT